MSDKDDSHADIVPRINRWSRDLGFQQCGIASVDLAEDEVRLQRWLELGYHGQMHYMSRHGVARARPARLRPGTVSVICVRMDYFPSDAAAAEPVLLDKHKAYVARYALGRDYHKLMRKRLQRLADRIADHVGPFGYRVFVDSGPLMEKPLARNAGLGWIGKHTNLINKRAGSWFFLGEILTDLPMQPATAATEHCGSCSACLGACPTGAIVAPFQLDARRCISYLTIELRGSIPEPLRGLVGNRIFGCDDCQLVCPWNKFASFSAERDFSPRHELDDATLVELFGWSEQQFLHRTEGSAIRRIGYECWLRNLAVALGNATPCQEVIAALRARLEHPSTLVREHVQWALARLGNIKLRPGSLETGSGFNDNDG